MKSLFGKLSRYKGVDDGVDPVWPSEPELINPFDLSSGVSTEPKELSEALEPKTSVADDPELLAAEHKDGRLKSLFNGFSLPSSGKTYSLLAFQAGSFGLRGALIRNTKHQAILGAVAESRNVDFTRAIADVVEQLRSHQKSLPKQAILITPSVISSIVELPVSPLRPRSDEEMQELIRWELEGTLTQQNKHWLIGSMLVERGYLTPYQRDELVEELQLRHSQGGQDGLLRFGDLAVQLNYITHEQLEECFVLQGKLIAVDDDLAYGWQAEEPQLTQGLSDEVLLSAADDGDSAHKWLVSGMSKAVRRRWVGAFNLNGIKVQAFYPSVGSSFAILSQRCFDQEQALLEIHQEQLAFISGSQSSISEIRVESRLHGEVRHDEIQSLLGVLPADLNRLYVNFQGKEIEELLFTLSSCIPIEVETLSLDGLDISKPDHLENEAMMGVLGAADHYLNHIPKGRLSWIPARETELSVWKKLLSPKVLIGSGVAIVIIAMCGFLGWMHWNMWQQQVRLDELSARYEKETKLKNQFAGIVADQEQLRSKINDARTETELNSAMIDAIVKDHPREKNLINILLKSLIVVTPEGVSIHSITQSEKLLMVSARAYSDTQGQQFVSALNKVMMPLSYQVFSSDVSRDDESESDPLPYQVNITLRHKIADLQKVLP